MILFPQVSESTEPVPNIWPIIRVRAVRAASRAMVSNAGGDSGHLLPASPQAGDASLAARAQVNVISVVLLLLHWPLPWPLVALLVKFERNQLCKDLQLQDHLLCC